MRPEQQAPGVVAIVLAVAAIALCCFGTLIVAGAGQRLSGVLTHSLRYVLPVVLALLFFVGVPAYRRWKRHQQKAIAADPSPAPDRTRLIEVKRPKVLRYCGMTHRRRI
jgi:fatty acid desaturase